MSSDNSSPDSARSLVVFLIADLRGYTRFTHERGDDSAARLASQFTALCRSAIEERAGRVMGLRGDEVIAVFSSARQALRAAVAIQSLCAVRATGDLPLVAGIGLDAGEPVQLADDFLGEAINVAARLCALAEPREVLATTTVTSLARRVEGLVYEERTPVALKGLSGAVRLCAVRLEGAEQSLAERDDDGDETHHPGAVPNAPFVFVSYSRGDSAFVVRLMADLASRGVFGWVDRHGLPPGTADWEQSLRTAIRACRALLLVASPDARQSRFVKAELAVAEMYDRPVVPVWAAGEQWLDCVPLALSSVQYVDARGDSYPRAVAALVAELAGPVDRPEAGAVVAVQGPDVALRNPYKGLRAFEEEDAGDFFGRTALVDTLLESLRATLTPGQQGGARLLAVVGPSGSGKSSVVRAGLLPRLKGGALPRSDAWVYLDPIVPGTHPLEALTVTLANMLGGGMHALREDLTADSARGLHLLARRLAMRPESQVVLFIDQFEELFTLTASEEERRQFVDILLAAVTEPRGPLLVVLTLRADFYDRPLAYPALGALLETHTRALLPMSVGDLREVIEEPARLPDVRLGFERGLVGDLLFEVGGQAGALPLLEFTLDQLFARREGRTLTVAAYQQIGGVRGALTRHAEATFAALPTEEHRTVARALFLRLIDPGVTEQDTTRRRAALSELTLPDAQQTVLLREVADDFVFARLLTTSEHAGVTTLEVSHEALIREWERLTGWLHEGREDIRRQQTIRGDAAAWARRGRPSDNLYRGSVLQEARAWAARNMASAEEVAFVEAGVAEAERREAEARAEQEERLRQAEALAAEQQRRAEAERQRAEAERLRAEEQGRRAAAEQQLRQLAEARALHQTRQAAAANLRSAARSRALVGAVGCAITAIMVALTAVNLDPLPAANFATLEGLFDFRVAHGPPISRAPIVLIAFDEKTTAALGEAGVVVPSRDYQAQLVDKLAADGAKVIGFDLIFATSKPQDGALSKALRASGRSVLQYRFANQNPPNPGATTQILPPPSLANAAVALGYGEISGNDSDGVYRRAAMVYTSSQNRHYLSWPAAMAKEYLGSLPANMLNRPTFMVNFVDRPGFDFPVIHYETFFSTGPGQRPPDPSLIRGKIVLIGWTGGATFHDSLPTPLSAGDRPGVDYMANAINTIVNDDPIIPIDPPQQDVFVLFVGLLVTLTALRLPHRAGTALCAAYLVGWIAFVYYMFLFHDSWLNVTAPALTIPVVYLGLLVVRYRIGRLDSTRPPGPYEESLVLQRPLATSHAARLLGAADALRAASGAPRPSTEQATHDRIVAALRVSLGDEAYRAAWGEGQAMTLEQAIALEVDKPWTA